MQGREKTDRTESLQGKVRNLRCEKQGTCRIRRQKPGSPPDKGTPQSTEKQRNHITGKPDPKDGLKGPSGAPPAAQDQKAKDRAGEAQNTRGGHG